MKTFKTLALVPALLLAACGGDEQIHKEKTTPGSLVYSYPMDGQADVSPKADIVLHFSHAIVDDESTLADKIQLDSSGTIPAFSVKKIGGGKSLKLEIADGQTLNSRTDYSVTFKEPLEAEGGRTVATPNAVGEEGIQFNTRADFSGIADLASTSDTFGVAWQVPNNDSLFQAMNFSTFRLAMTQPVHPEWQKHGGTIELLDRNGEAVPATVLVKGNRITVDPCVTELKINCGSRDDVLNAGETYTLKINNLASLVNGPDGDRYSEEFSFTPRATGPTAVLAQDAIDSIDGRYTSILNGQAINGVVLNSVLQGVTDSSQQTGSLFAELGHAPSFAADEAIPLRIPKGSVLESTSLSIKVGGKVQALNIDDGSAQETGTIKVTMLSDASGYMTPNPYSNHKTAPRHITLFMDVSMNTEEKMPNAALSQDLMGVELRGIVRVQDGVLTIDAIGMVEPNLLGQEYTDSTIAFHLQANMDGKGLDAADEWEATRDVTPPRLVSWSPGAEDANPSTRQSMHRPGDPVILFFDEPLDPASISGSVNLTHASDGSPVAFKHMLDGTTLTLLPENGLEHGSTYTISVNGITDLAGNPTAHPDLSLSLAEAFEPIYAPGVTDEDGNSLQARVSPVVLTSNAGFACATTAPDLRENGLSQGQCLDGAPDDRPFPTDDLPILDVASDQPLSLVFSQSMDLETINAETFKVERVTVDSAGTILSETPVEGRYQTYDRAVKFFPHTPWDTSENGTFYRYTLKTKSEPCVSENVNEAICSVHGMPLNTSPLADPLQTGSSAPLASYFKSGSPKNHVMVALHNRPVRDVNSNYWIDTNEPFPYSEEEDLITSDEEGNPLDEPYYPTPPNAARLTVSGTPFVLDGDGTGWFGCDDKGACPDKQFIYKTAGLLTEVVGPVSEENPAPSHPFGEGEQDRGIRVLLHPANLITTGAELHLKNNSGASVSNLLLSGGQNTGPQILRMRYAKDHPECDETLGTCTRNRLIEGRIIETAEGPRFKTRVDLLLDAPALTLPIDGLAHNLFSYPFSLDLEGDITFFDDGRMQIEQTNLGVADIAVSIRIPPTNALNSILAGLVDLINLTNRCTGPWYDICYTWVERPADDPDPLEGGAVSAPLSLPPGAVYLNYVSYPVKDMPVAQ